MSSQKAKTDDFVEQVDNIYILEAIKKSFSGDFVLHRGISLNKKDQHFKQIITSVSINFHDFVIVLITKTNSYTRQENVCAFAHACSVCYVSDSLITTFFLYFSITSPAQVRLTKTRRGRPR